MRKNNKAFTLIEVIIASAILSITVFGVYKLIGENSKLINNSDNYLQLNNLFLNLEECIKSKGYDSFSDNSTTEINFGTNLDECNTGTADKVEINNIDYFLNAKIASGDKNPDYIDFELEIEGDGVAIEKKDFRLYK